MNYYGYRWEQRDLSQRHWSGDPQDGGEAIAHCFHHNHYYERGEGGCRYCPCYEPAPEPDHRRPIGPDLPHPTTGNDDLPVPLPF